MGWDGKLASTGNRLRTHDIIGGLNLLIIMARIILMEDDDLFRETIMRVLTEAGHSVKAAANGFDGVAIYRTESAPWLSSSSRHRRKWTGETAV